MSNFPNIENPNNTLTLKNISELYNTHNNISKVYHFQYKTDQSATNFGHLHQSLLDKESHHIIHSVKSYRVSNNKKNLILESGDRTIGSHVIAYDHIPDDYRFDIIDSILDGKTLIIYDKCNKCTKNPSDINANQQVVKKN